MPNHERLLLVLPSIPIPANSGGALRSLHLVRALDRAFQITVVAPAPQRLEGELFRSMLRGRLVAVPLSSGPARAWNHATSIWRGEPIGYFRYATAELKRAILLLLKHGGFSAVHFDRLHTGRLLSSIQRAARAEGLSLPTVLDAHNVETELCRRLGEISSPLLKPVFGFQVSRLRKLEEGTVSAADAVLTCSDRERLLLEAMGGRRVQVIPNGVSLGKWTRAGRSRAQDVVFVGSMDWRPNRDAASYLAKEIWPLCRERLAGSKLLLVGREPPRGLWNLATPDIEVTGTVESVVPYVESAFATAVPLRAGSGTRLKILEAAGARVPIVATRLAAEGLPLVDGKQIVYAETAREFADALVKLREEPEWARMLAENAFEVAQRFDWDRVGGTLVDFYQQLLETQWATGKSPMRHGAYSDDGRRSTSLCLNHTT